MATITNPLEDLIVRARNGSLALVVAPAQYVDGLDVRIVIPKGHHKGGERLIWAHDMYEVVGHLRPKEH